MLGCFTIAYGTVHIQTGVHHGSASNVTMLCSESTLALLLLYFAYTRHDMSLAVFAVIPAIFAVYCAVAYATGTQQHAKRSHAAHKAE